MAKKHSSKTATEKALSASEPRLQIYTSWQGINFAQAPLGWEPFETPNFNKQNQNDLKPNFFHVQNNLVTTDNLTIETRMDSEIIGEAPWIDDEDHTKGKYKFTGVSCMYHRWLFCVVRQEIPDAQPLHEGDGTFKDRIAWRDITQANLNEWNIIALSDAENDGNEPSGYEIAEIGYFETQLIATTWHKTDDNSDSETEYEGEIFTATLTYTKTHDTKARGIVVESDSLSIGAMESVPYVPNPRDLTFPNQPQDNDGENTTSKPIFRVKNTKTGNLHRASTELDSEALVEISYVYVNKFGSTIASDTASMHFTVAPQNWNANQYLNISRKFPVIDGNQTFVEKYEITGVDVYASVEGYQTKSFIVHTDVKPSATAWSVNWLGGMQDVSQWTNVQLEEPQENTTKGVRASHFANHDSRLYFWGDPKYPYRLYIAGNPGSELSVARGLGGAYIDIEPGTGLEVKGTAKWKTSSGANIITIMCGNPNTNMVKRFNLVETNLAITNEVSSKGYMYEEVSNVVGCNSRWGYGVFADGLYSINRYGLMLTTMAMEYNNQMRTESISEAIKPIFTERLGTRLDDARMCFIDNVIYIVLSEETPNNTPTNLDQVVICYDIGSKAWYTLTSDEIMGHGDGDTELILHALPIDSHEHEEGLGLITQNKVILYPNTGIQAEVAPEFDIMLETGELVGKQPKQMTIYLCQLELRFDYFIGTATVEIEGIDYYGRPIVAHKELNRRIRGQSNTGSPSNLDENNNEVVMRDYIEWIRVDKLVESYRLRIKGPARFRLNSINARVYVYDDKIGMPYGYDTHVYYQNRYDSTNDDNHWIRDYNNLRRTLLT